MHVRVPKLPLLAVCLLLWSGVGSAQRVCKKGIPCGNACIAANRTCRVGPAKPTPTASADTAGQALLSPSARAESIPPRAAVIADSGGPLLAAGGTTKVWLNTKSRVYHCPGSRYYGTSSAGEFGTERAATAAGYRPAYGKRCGA